jgi:hypothetical protein
MSETDSFIEEVTEEVRKDRLFGLLKRYGWIAILAVLVLVGGASWNEYRKASDAAAAEAKGDAILAAIESGPGAERLDAFAALPGDLQSSPVVAMLRAGEALVAEDAEAAAADLAALAADAAQPQIYRDMALLKHAILTAGEVAPQERIAALANLARPGGTFRVLAEEQIALAELEQGNREAAIERLEALVVDAESSRGLRERAQQLIVALGAE